MEVPVRASVLINPSLTIYFQPAGRKHEECSTHRKHTTAIIDRIHSQHVLAGIQLSCIIESAVVLFWCLENTPTPPVEKDNIELQRRANYALTARTVS